MSITAWSPGFSHLRTTHLHLYSYLDGYHSILSWTLLSEDGISLSVLLPNSTASSLGSHLGTTASSPFGLSPRASQHHLLGSHEHATSASFGFLPVRHNMLPWALPWSFTVSPVCPFAAFSAHLPPLFP